ncbi:MAG TPA: TonB-dependent receptor [Opitutaceae bacterium]
MPNTPLRVAFAVLSVLGCTLARGQSSAPASAEKTTEMDKVQVNAEAYKPVKVDIPRFLIGPPPIGGAFPPNLQFNTMGPMVVTANRMQQAPTEVAATLKVLYADTLRATPSATLDGALRSVPGFSLFRRSDSFSANPTAQGVSLRGLGPTGASRALLLLDGVPLNDPFGGWVAWTKLPREGLGRVEVVPGGGASAWGDAALGGVVQIFSANPAARLEVYDRPPAPIGWTQVGTARLAAIVGDYDTRSAEVAVTLPVGQGVLQILGRTFGTGGFSLVAPEDRGSIDQAAWNRHRWLTLRFRQPVGKLDLLATARVFEETRNNGTPYQRNGSREKFLSLSLAGKPSDAFFWHAVAYVQSQGFASTFSSVNATRTAETPASDQFAVPSTAFGAAWTGLLTHGDQSRTSFGADTRRVRGETREHFTFAAGNFTRLRVASGQQAFRRPTLNELYRPFRVGPNITEANAALGTERVRTAEFGATWSLPDPKNSKAPARLSLGATAFHNDLRDAVGNVTLARGPGTFPLFGSIAAGGVGRQRLNLDRTRVRGLELSATARPLPDLAFRAEYLYNDARVRRAAIAPALVGNRVAQVPRHTASLGASWKAPGQFTFVPRVRWIGRQFEDDENQLTLGEVVIADLSVSRPLTKQLELFLTCENLGNARIETGRTADGLVNTGTPRLLLGGLRGSW